MIKSEMVIRVYEEAARQRRRILAKSDISHFLLPLYFFCFPFLRPASRPWAVVIWLTKAGNSAAMGVYGRNGLLSTGVLLVTLNVSLHNRPLLFSLFDSNQQLLSAKV